MVWGSSMRKPDIGDRGLVALVDGIIEQGATMRTVVVLR